MPLGAPLGGAGPRSCCGLRAHPPRPTPSGPWAGPSWSSAPWPTGGRPGRPLRWPPRRRRTEAPCMSSRRLRALTGSVGRRCSSSCSSASCLAGRTASGPRSSAAPTPRTSPRPRCGAGAASTPASPGRGPPASTRPWSATTGKRRFSLARCLAFLARTAPPPASRCGSAASGPWSATAIGRRASRCVRRPCRPSGRSRSPSKPRSAFNQHTTSGAWNGRRRSWSSKT
mmetsp:Transcript_82134/g.266030  ORF Transcript_82134/g.266030 Transcript_82134/m.266030 type:complete len:228 (+) Transcript_82134:885-1568(+)